jgi:hypothetical protein
MWPGAAPDWLIPCAWAVEIDQPDADKLSHASRLPYVKQIVLKNVSPTTSLGPLANWTALERLEIRGAGLSDELISPLGSLQSLTHFMLVGGTIDRQSTDALS